MILIVMCLYALLLLVTASYLLVHRKRQFLIFNMPSQSLAINMTITAVLLILSAVFCVVAAVLGSKALCLIGLAASMFFVAIFFFSLTQAMNTK